MSWLISKALMNSLSLPEPVEVFSEDTCLDGEQSAPLNGSHTQLAYCAPDKMTGFSRLSRFGMTYKPLTESRGEELLTLYREVFHARTYPLQEKAQELTEIEAECGSTWPVSFANLSVDGSMWKTAQHSLLEDLEQSLETWPSWGSMRDGECFHAEMSAAFTYENGFGLQLPTPRSCSAMAAQITEKTAQYKNPNLETVLARLMLPTIGANEGRGASKDRFSGSPAFRGAKMCEGLRTCETDPIYLNPSFAELTMMWPQGWTDLKPLAMDKFQEWQQQHGES